MKRIFFPAGLLLFFLLVSIPSAAQATTVFSPVVEIDIDPGSTGQGVVKVYNETDQPMVLTSSVEPFIASGEDGKPLYLPPDDSQAYLQWFSVSEEAITLQPHQGLIIPFTITVPDNAVPGGYYVVLFWQAPAAQSGAAGAVGVSSKVGTLVFLRVNGEIAEAGALSEFGIKPPRRFFFGFPITFSSRFTNTGNIYLKPGGTITLTSRWGDTVELPLNAELRAVLPGSTRRFDTVWGQYGGGTIINKFFKGLEQELNLMAVGPYTAQATITYGTEAVLLHSEPLTFWFIPIRTIIVIVFGVIVFIFLLRINKKVKRLKSSGTEKR